jgi:4-carboxymuconolactone decarboxylase
MTYPAYSAALLALCLTSVPPPAAADERQARGEALFLELNNGRPQPTLEALRRDFPMLADGIVGYALGEVWAQTTLDHRTRQSAAVSAFAALGHQPFLRIHAEFALNVGVTEEELKQIVNLTSVHAGFPPAISAAQTLSTLFAERAAAR